MKKSVRAMHVGFRPATDANGVTKSGAYKPGLRLAVVRFKPAVETPKVRAEPPIDLEVGSLFLPTTGCYAYAAVALILATNSVATAHMVNAKGARYHVQLCVYTSGSHLPPAARQLPYRSLEDCHIVRVSNARE